MGCVTGKLDVDLERVVAAVEALARGTLRDGAFDYVTKPVQLGRLREVLAAALVLSGKVPPA